MLRLTPAPLHRLALKLAHGARRQWWALRKPLLLGCRVLACDPAGHLLLIRHSYGSSAWTVPGGGLRAGEDPVAAARRECVEETGCALAEARLVGVVDEPLFGTTNRVCIVVGTVRGTPQPDGREVIAAQFFALDALPAPLAPRLAAGLSGWLAADPQAG